MLSSPTLTRPAYLSQLFRVCGLFAVFAFFIFLSGGAQAQTYFSGTPQTIDNGVDDGGVGQYTSQTIVNGNPAISYYDKTNTSLKYVRALDAEGASWGTPVTVDLAGDVGLWTSLKMVDGFPAISYYSNSSKILKYVRALDINGDSWGRPLKIDSGGDVGHSSSLEVVNGYPAISYYDNIAKELKYIRATEPTGTIVPWNTPVIIDCDGNTGLYGSLEVVAGRPAIAYHQATGLNLRYVRAADADGAAWGAPQTIVSGGTTGWYPSLAIVNGNPAISFLHPSGQSLRYIRATSVDGSTWGTSITLDAGGAGNYSSLVVVNGKPAISYFTADHSNLKYVRALDANGATPAAWGPRITLDSEGSTGIFTSLAVAGGKPAISYWDKTNGNLKHIRATGANGDSWQTPVAVDVGSGGSVGQYTSLAIVDGNPAVSYYDFAEGIDLRYIRALDPRGKDWARPVLVDTGGSVGQFTSLRVVNGNPAISYYDKSNGDLKYVRALDPGGTGWGTPVTIDSAGDVGQYTSLEIVGGSPAISYYDLTNGDLKFIRASDSNGSTWAAPPMTVDSVGDVGQYASLKIVGGNPAIGYYDMTNLDLKYVRALTPDGSTWNTPVTIDSPGNVGQYASLEVVNGRPALSYYEAGGPNNLKYLRADSIDGSTWGILPVTIDSSGSVGGHTSLAVVNGKPAISYYDSTGGNLKYVRAKTADGQTLADWGVPATIDSAGAIGQYTSLGGIDCGAAVSYFSATNGDLKYVRANPAWNGEITADWHTGMNWAFGCVPVPGESVSLPNSNVVNEAVISNGDVIVGDLTLGTNRTVTVSGNRTLTINGVLTMNGGMITVETGSKIILACNASVTGVSVTDFIAGTVTKEFCDAETFTFPVGEITGAAEYSPMKAVIITGTFPPDAAVPPSLTVSVTDTWLPGLVQSSAVSRYWKVTENGDLIADMTFKYLDPADVNGDEMGYKVFRHTGGSTVEILPSSSDPMEDTATVTGVNTFSDWGIGKVAPSAASIIIGGQVTDREGRGLAAAQVTMVDQNGAARIAHTNPFGYYRFENVEAGQAYVISAAAKRYRFLVRIVNAGEDITDLNFIAQ